MAGARLGLDLRAGLPGGSLRDLMQMSDADLGRLRIDGLMRDPMYIATGSVQPPETYAAPLMSRTA